MFTKSKLNFLVILSILLLFVFTAIAMFSVNQIQKVNDITLSCDCLATQNIKNNKAIDTSVKHNKYDFKLFGIIPIGKSTETTEKKFVQLGGYPIGVAIDTNGLYVTSKVSVVTNKGAVCPVVDCDIKSGDVLVAIDDIKLEKIGQISSILQSDKEITIKIRRGNQEKDYLITPALDALSGKYKLGLLLQDQIEGIGTMTYTDNDNFYALGHTVKDMNGGNVIATSGNIYNSYINGYVRGQKGRAGELNGSFSTIESSLGKITSNNNYGLYGKLQNSVTTQSIELGSRADVQPGSAYIYSTIDGQSPQKYEIQIIKANNQTSPAEKSMVLRIVDERLLSTTGGIVQGMSGSPIIQNDKLVGAVTHVFTSDPTKGYGVYIDWMKP